MFVTSETAHFEISLLNFNAPLNAVEKRYKRKSKQKNNIKKRTEKNNYIVDIYVPVRM